MGVSSLAVMANSLTLQFHRPLKLEVGQPGVASEKADSEADLGQSRRRGTFDLQKFAEKTLV